MSQNRWPEDADQLALVVDPNGAVSVTPGRSGPVVRLASGAEATHRPTALGASRWLIYFSERIRAGADLADVLDEVIAWGLKTRERVKG